MQRFLPALPRLIKILQVLRSTSSISMCTNSLVEERSMPRMKILNSAEREMFEPPATSKVS